MADNTIGDTTLAELGVLPGRSMQQGSRIRATSKIASAAKRPLGSKGRISDAENTHDPIKPTVAPRARTQSSITSMLPAPSRLRTLSTVSSSLSTRPAAPSTRIQHESTISESSNAGSMRIRRIKSGTLKRETAGSLPQEVPIPRLKKSSAIPTVTSASGVPQSRQRRSKTPITAQRIRTGLPPPPSSHRASPSHRAAVGVRKGSHRSHTPQRKPKMSSTLNDLLAATSSLDSPTLDDLTRSVDGFQKEMLSPVRRSSRPPAPSLLELEKERQSHQKTREECSALQAQLEAAKKETAMISAMASSVETDLSLTRQELRVYQSNVDQCTSIRGELEFMRWDDLALACKAEARARRTDLEMLGVLKDGLEALQAGL